MNEKALQYLDDAKVFCARNLPVFASQSIEKAIACINSEWKYVSDGEIPDNCEFKKVCAINVAHDFIARYRTTVGFWEDTNGMSLNVKVYCWKEPEQLPPVK